MSAAAAYALVFLTVLLTVYGQFAIKWQVLSAQALPATSGGKLAYMAQLLTSPLIISAIAAAFLASLCWMLAMTRLQLSHAYPMTALTFVLVVIGSSIFFDEPISTLKLCGLALIIAGITVGSQG
jgi:multidrug transporter EmrE-like cation transporter